MIDRLVVKTSIAFNSVHPEEDSEAAQGLGHHCRLHADPRFSRMFATSHHAGQVEALAELAP
ncbi:hypothetical protein [Geminicoccus harenae]|uniref:hypothetical protein n=1 Tax=Geminicoccus harenae TaxID=2498453 RepID=UPI00168BABBC|nr:hypothetical protein [Geminicoccus harenae]